jgi:glycosyltransferase involved in cell wall biosynthesis
MVVPYPILPTDEGGRVRAFNLLKYHSRNGKAILFSPRSIAYSSEHLPFRVYQTTPARRINQIIHPAFMRRAYAIAWDERPDVFVAEYPWSGLHAAYLARRLGVPFVYDAPNVEADRFRATGARTWPAIAMYERVITRLADAVFAVSEDDRVRFRRRGVSENKLQVVPNGIDPSVLRPDAASRDRVRRDLGLPEDTRMILFFGQLDYAPNREAVGLIHDEVLPRLDALGGQYMFIIAGKNGEKMRSFYVHPRLRFTGPVPAIADYINAADAVAVPVCSGGGTRLKVLESVACGAPVVSTTAGAEGVDTAACGDLLTVVDDWDSFVRALASGTTRPRGNVPAAFIDMYSWAHIVDRIRWPAPKPQKRVPS